MFPSLIVRVLSNYGHYGVFALAVLFGVFLFWRACRHELIESTLALDLVVVGSIGALVGGRIFEFIARHQYFNWSIKRLVFINVYPGLDIYGAILGAVLAMYLILHSRKINFWSVFDLSAAPLAFGQAIIAIGRFLEKEHAFIFLYYFSGYFSIFLVLKRLAKRTRHHGFFICFYLISIAILDLVLFWLRDDMTYLWGKVSYQLVMPLVFLALVLGIWYRVSKRKVTDDIKKIFAYSLLVIFGIKRTIVSTNEAGKISKTIIFLPLTLAKLVTNIIKLTLREIILGLRDFLYVLGFKK